MMSGKERTAEQPAMAAVAVGERRSALLSRIAALLKPIFCSALAHCNNRSIYLILFICQTNLLLC
jgi:hypothetical protein